MSVSLSFLGGAGTVTGSKFLVEHDRHRVLVDCGLFQGYKQLRRRNWSPLPLSFRTLDAVVLTHAHIDHSGALPLLTRGGFGGRVHASAATFALCQMLLPDSARIHEADAAYANRKGFSRHRPALPLYTERDARDALARFEPQPFGTPFEPARGFSCSFSRAGHILGAAMVRMTVGGVSVLFSGDLGRPEDALIPAPVRREPTHHPDLRQRHGHGRARRPPPAPLCRRRAQHDLELGWTCEVPQMQDVVRL